MRKSSLTFASFVLVLFWPSLGDSRCAQDPERSPHPPLQCSGKPNDCKKPVRFLSREGGCVCFACEYGTKSQKTVCTANTDDLKLFIALERESDHKGRDKDQDAITPPQH